MVTALLVLLLVSALVVGMSWMVMTDQHLGSNNQNREAAFYGAEAGMEKLTADLGNAYASQGDITGANLTSAPITVPPTLPGITYTNAAGASTYTVTCNGCPGAPTSTSATILPPSPYAGMQGLITPFTLSVAAQTSSGSEVKLVRQIQLVAIPVFQFGIFSQTDLAFFAGPPFDFGGRVHTNGNLWLAANTGPLYMGDKVTVSGQVIRSNLENGYPGGGGTITAGGTYGGTVNIALEPLPIPPNPVRPPYVAAQWQALGQNQGSVTGASVYGAVSTVANPAWPGIEVSFNNMIESGAPPLNLQSTALAGLVTPITLIERPVQGELAANPSQFNERYFSGPASLGQVSLRILLDDYGTDGTCGTADMTKLDTVTATPPVDLATLAFAAGLPYNAAPLWYTAATKIPLPTSDATTPYSAANGYWIKNGYPIITGCIKIEYESAAGAFTDVTEQILNYGFTGANLYAKNWGSVPPTVPSLPTNGTVVGPTACANVSPNAIIRLARMRDNPASAAAANSYCGTTTDVTPTDYWPNVLYDTREGVSRDLDPSPAGGDPNNPNKNPYITAQGVMNYIELDMGNLAKWFLGTLAGSTGTNASNVGGYAVYFSDRRGDQIDPSSGTKTGAFGFDDIINGTFDPVNGCPDNALDAGEDFTGDGVFRTYGGRPISAGPLLVDSPPTLGYSPVPGSPYITTVNAPNAIPNLTKNPNCGAAFNPPGAPGPNYVYNYTQDARENPPIFFRRALKIVDGATINLGTACYGAAPNPPCGITLASENPVYIQGEFNDGGVNTSAFTGASVAASVAADSVTLLSDNWNDVNTFISPYNPAGQTTPTGRPSVTTTYRMGIIAGKGVPFPLPAGGVQDYGTDGGLHNFLRFEEDWGGQTLNYRGSLVSFFYSVQGIGPYKCCTTVYGAPGRTYSFDENFTLGPSWLPPRTPTLRSINTVGFTQELLPTQ